jgi:hypothetical protein
MLLIHASAVIKICLAIEHSFYKVNIKFIPAGAGIQTSEYSDKNAIMADSIRYCLFENQLKVERIRELYESADDLSGNRASIPSTHLGGSHAIEQQGRGRRCVPTVREQVHLCGETRKNTFIFPCPMRP